MVVANVPLDSRCPKCCECFAVRVCLDLSIFFFKTFILVSYSISFVAPNQPFVLSRDKFVASKMKD